MYYHEWGDDWFLEHGDKLYQAERWLCNWFHRLTGGYLSSKEKYGTLRYEYFIYGRFSPYWDRIWNKYARWILYLLIKKAIIKFPDIKEELLDDYEWFDEKHWEKIK